MGLYLRYRPNKAEWTESSIRFYLTKPRNICVSVIYKYCNFGVLNSVSVILTRINPSRNWPLLTFLHFKRSVIIVTNSTIKKVNFRNKYLYIGSNYYSKAESISPSFNYVQLKDDIKGLKDVRDWNPRKTYGHHFQDSPERSSAAHFYLNQLMSANHISLWEYNVIVVIIRYSYNNMLKW